MDFSERVAVLHGAEHDQHLFEMLSADIRMPHSLLNYILLCCNPFVGANIGLINLRRSRDVFVLFLVCLFVCYPRFSSLWPAFILTVHINALYNESVHGREEHAT